MQSQRERQRDTLREAVRAIQASRDTPATLEELFRFVILGGVAECRTGCPWLIPPHSALHTSLPTAARSLQAHQLCQKQVTACTLLSVCRPLRCSAVECEVQENEGAALHALLGDECQRKAAEELAVLAVGVALDSTTFLQHVVRLWESYSSQLSLIR